MINETNFYVASTALFEPCEAPDREPDSLPKGSESEYWFEDGCLIRRSNHWGNVAACHWALFPPVGVALVASANPKFRAMNTKRDGKLIAVTARVPFVQMSWITTSQFAELSHKKRESMLHVFPEHADELKRRYNL